MVAVAALSALALRFWPDRSAKAEPNGLSQMRAELEETRRDLASMQRAQAVLTAQRLNELSASQGASAATQRQTAQEVEVGPADGLPEAAPDEATLERVRAEEEAATAVRYQRLASELESEPRDSAWANDTESAYRNHVEAFDATLRGAKPNIVSMECRTSLCRLELAFSEEEDAHQYGGQLAQHPSVQRGTYRHVKTDGAVRTVAYLARGDRSIYPLNSPEASPTEH